MSKLSALIALNQFKGSLSNEEVCLAVSQSLKKSGIGFDTLPIGDGGRGTQNAVRKVFGGTISKFVVSGPLNKPCTVKVLCIPNARTPKKIYIESADCCGYHLIPEKKHDVMRASSIGLGEVLQQVFLRWKKTLKTIYIGLGDSIVSDAGMGMLTGLGFKFFDKSNHKIWGNANGLRLIDHIKIPEQRIWEHFEIIVLCDVLNPLYGPNGSAAVFAPQKGASHGQVKLIEKGLLNFSNQLKKLSGISLKDTPMSGAAGGISASLHAFLHARLVHGASFLLDWLNFDSLMKKHSFVITGEGCTDRQTLNGKAPLECLNRAAKLGKKSIILSGSLGPGYQAILKHPGVMGCFATGKSPSAKTAIKNTTLELFKNPNLLESLKDFS